MLSIIPHLYPLLVLFILGVSVGSFIGVLGDRIPKRESFLKGRSYCDHCGKKLSALDLVPIFSFIFLNGRCRYCRASLSPFYPIVEILTGVFFVLTFLYLQAQNNLQSPVSSFQFLGELFVYLFLISSFLAIFFSDLKYGIIPDVVLFPATVVFLIFLVLKNQNFPISNFASGLGAFLFFFILFILTRGKGMGFGDVKFAFLMGLFLGYPLIVLGLYSAFLTGALASIILILWRKKKFRGSTIPFGPFLVLGTLLAFFLEKQLLQIAGALF